MAGQSPEETQDSQTETLESNNDTTGGSSQKAHSSNTESKVKKTTGHKENL